ncbi:MAG: sulfite exporter TauE/SafE family protein [Thermoplasmata archaeon]|nr:sulfite exporter TauE/SafE family protein [Thermoplasmata archaeon]
MGPLIDLAGSVPTIVIVLLLVAIAVGAGLVGSLIGIGGGLFLVPVLVLVFGLDIHYAIAASLIGVIANSCASGASYVDQGLTDLRIGMFLESASTVGGLLGATISVTILASRSNVLALAFVAVVAIAIALMLRQGGAPTDPNAPMDAIATRLRLQGVYREVGTGRTLPYGVRHSGEGLAFAGVAGYAAALLGIGGGTFNVPAMNAVMNVPLRIATATSTFKIGLVASAGTIVYLFAGDVLLFIAAPVALGSMVGSLVGSHYQFRAPPGALRSLFLVVLAIAAASMAARGLGYLS